MNLPDKFGKIRRADSLRAALFLIESQSGVCSIKEGFLVDILAHHLLKPKA